MSIELYITLVIPITSSNKENRQHGYKNYRTDGVAFLARYIAADKMPFYQGLTVKWVPLKHTLILPISESTF